MTIKTKAAGYSVTEIMVGLAVASVTMAGIMQIMLQISNLNLASRLQNLVNDTYLLGLHVASHPALFAADRGANANPLGISPQLSACLAQKGNGCDQLPEVKAGFKPLPDAIDKQLNSSFNYSGTCNAIDAGCLVTRSTSYRWECPAPTYCTGLRVNLASTPILSALGDSNASANKSNAASRTPIKPRMGSLLIPARQFVSKAEVSFTCPGTPQPSKAIFGIDYTHLTDSANCSTYDPGVTCASPMATYVNGQGCVQPQTNGCGDGYQTVGLFANQASCIPAGGTAATVTLPTTPVGPTPVRPIEPTPVTPTTVTPPQQGVWYYQINIGVITQPPIGPAGPCPTPFGLWTACSPIGRVCYQTLIIDIAHFQSVYQCYDTSTATDG